MTEDKLYRMDQEVVIYFHSDNTVCTKYSKTLQFTLPFLNTAQHYNLYYGRLHFKNAEKVIDKKFNMPH